MALDTTLDDDLAAEGVAREVAHRLQAMRKAAGYEISDRVDVAVAGDDATLDQLRPFQSWLADELLASSVELGPEAVVAAADADEQLDLDGVSLRLSVARA